MVSKFDSVFLFKPTKPFSFAVLSWCRVRLRNLTDAPTCASVLPISTRHEAYYNAGGPITVVVLDFRATRLMPLPFIKVALKKPWDHFCQLVVKKITQTMQRSYSAPLVLLFMKPVVLGSMAYNNTPPPPFKGTHRRALSAP